MRTISFEVLCRILDDCSAVIWGDEKLLTHPSYQYPEDEGGGGDFLYLEGDDGDYHEFEAYFYKKDNEMVRVQGNSFILVDGNKDEVEITPVFSKDLFEYQ
jgi:hypothetical protein